MQAIGRPPRQAPGGAPVPYEFPMWPVGIREPFRTRRFECGKDLHRSFGIPREDKPARLTQLAKNYDFFGATAAFFFGHSSARSDRASGPTSAC